jgi:hypothetical protein
MYALRAINPALVSPFQQPRIFHSEQRIFVILPQLAAAKPMRFGAAGKGLHKS